MCQFFHFDIQNFWKAAMWALSAIGTPTGNPGSTTGSTGPLEHLSKIHCVTRNSCSCGVWPLTYYAISPQQISCYLCNKKMTAFAVLESSPVVGSSRNKTDGEMINSIPMFALFLSPPDTPRINSVPTWSIFFFFKFLLYFIFCGDNVILCGATGTFCSGFQLTMPMGFKVRVDAPLPMLYCHLCIMGPRSQLWSGHEPLACWANVLSIWPHRLASQLVPDTAFTISPS